MFELQTLYKCVPAGVFVHQSHFVCCVTSVVFRTVYIHKCLFVFPRLFDCDVYHSTAIGDANLGDCSVKNISSESPAGGLTRGSNSYSIWVFGMEYW